MGLADLLYAIAACLRRLCKSTTLFACKLNLEMTMDGMNQLTSFRGLWKYDPYVAMMNP